MFEVSERLHDFFEARRLKVFTNTTPCCVDFFNAEAKGEVSEGIYQFKDGRLTVLVNINAGAKERPADFEARRKSGHIFYVVERQK